jgi:hypothetical protein
MPIDSGRFERWRVRHLDGGVDEAIETSAAVDARPPASALFPSRM